MLFTPRPRVITKITTKISSSWWGLTGTSYVPIKVLPHLPHVGKQGVKPGIRLKLRPQGRATNLPLSLSKTWGLDQKFCPTVREIAFQDRLPSYSTTGGRWATLIGALFCCSGF